MSEKPMSYVKTLFMRKMWEGKDKPIFPNPVKDFCESIEADDVKDGPINRHDNQVERQP